MRWPAPLFAHQQVGLIILGLPCTADSDNCHRDSGWLPQSSPAQLHCCPNACLEVLQPHPMVALAQSDVGLEGGNLRMLPLVNEQPSIHPQAHAVVY